jgi:hypothetical protein
MRVENEKVNLQGPTPGFYNILSALKKSGGDTV